MTATLMIIGWTIAGTLTALGVLGLSELIAARVRRARVVRRIREL
jgi:hypothetical protein